MYSYGYSRGFELKVFTSGYYGAVKDSEALLSLYLSLRMMGIRGIR